MIRDLKVAKQEEDIGFYAGFVGAAYFLGRTTSAVPWGMFADKYGRKPCIMISILSVIVFNTLFGLSTTYWMAIITRGLLGLLCGILGPIKAYASEVCRKEHQALGISLVTSSRSIALITGPAIGGFLARPAKKYPNLFSEESIFGRFPYFLPCLVISALAAAAGVACIWLPETLHMYHDEKMEAIDAMGAQVTDLNIEDGKANQLGSDRMASTKSLLKNRQLMSAITLYCVFSLHDTAYLEIFSLWAVSSRKYRGLSLTSQDVGTALAISGYDYCCVQHSTKHSSDTRTKGCCQWYLCDSDVNI
uniref:Major facilitator superfamily (MFS) profile domain-containing protein n=1 Tax=Triticum aestivum TaxID=4565 RepID=A0A3B6N2J7_WHEAT